MMLGRHFKVPDGVDIEALKREQEKLAKKVVLGDGFEEIKSIAGFDLAYVKTDNAIYGFASSVLLDYESMEVMEERVARLRITFPYIPTFLSYRELEGVKKVYAMLKHKPDVIMLNGQGIAHPRFFGLASHAGVVLDKPSIGIAARRLVGEWDERELKRTGKSRIMFNGRQVGWVMISKKACRPVFISPGHKVSLKSALFIARYCIRKHKLPEPIRLAHNLATREAREFA